MKQGVPSQEVSPGLGAHRPQAFPLQADRLLASSSSSSEAARPVSNGCWMVVCTITGAPLDHLLDLCSSPLQCRCVLPEISAQGCNEAVIQMIRLLPLKHA